ncbi:hypothetical protein O181_055623 [Austropuccinia psidii MF-1]|uniref:Uncharacterized protein n=1 Tax=Austropuccinia psidii MF-1 TaxID=1389203 RepID=A0A9Q3EBJ6_9BASI|nr:hypothetical protein [Austropuccinia psidii MF-1]
MLICCPTLLTTQLEEFLPKTPLQGLLCGCDDGDRDPKQANGNDSRQLSLFLPVSICPPPLLGHHPMVTSLLDRSKVIIRPMKDEPSQHNEPPTPGPSPSSKPPEDVPTCEPEVEVAPTQSTEDPFACPTTPPSIILIDNMPIGSPLPNSATFPLWDPSPHSHNDTRQEFTGLQPTLMIP